jgi:methionine synthase II (cobalamin-independent)
MFGTLLGALPAPPEHAGEAVAAAVRTQESAGLEPITDGRLGPTSPFALGADAWVGWSAPVSVAGWEATAALTNRAVKQALPGPYSLARAAAPRERDLEALAVRIAEGLRREVEALAAAGCPLVEIDEAEAHRIGEREVHRRAFREAHARIATAVRNTHLTLSITGGSAWPAGPETILAAPYASLAVDLIAGPDNWRLVSEAPTDRGIVAGALTSKPGDDGPEVLLYAANYAASTGGRGRARVGLGTSAGLDRLAWPAAVEKLRRLGEGVRIASLPPSEAVHELDPRAVNARSAALGAVSSRNPRRAGPSD